ncbi:MAG: single-stranded-DNA-specific exonuclease RecJ, partial [Alphaproteobacteria bacterium]|nr:single-stranded-DNA-specific exonuclease RecJ [Alphaproteobacteria bacterium]
PSDDVPAFLSPSLKNDFPDPFSLQDMEKMADDLADSIADGRKIGVFADFDVDGATSAALLLRFLRHIGQEAPLYIPDRITEGYGPNSKAFQTLKDQGAEIVFVCDCGITAFDPIAAGRNCGLEIVVLDHHEAEDTLPPANHVIDPKRKEDTSGLSMLAACGVTFMACVAINAKLRAAGYYARTGLAEPPLKTWLDIVALGTVCDMVPLVGANRLFVKTGFSLMAHTENPGLKALLAVAGVNDAPTPYTAGFVLGPRINAGSRVHRADLGARLLATDDPEEAKNIAWTLNDCNAKRREIERQMIEEAIGQIESKALQNAPVIVVGDEGWHPGLSGLVAGRIKEKYGKPAVAVTYAPGPDNALEGRGSGRSVPGVNMGAAFIDARHAGLLIKGGGHAMAAGFTILPDRLPDFTAFLTAHVLKQQEGVPAVNDLAIDAVLSVRGATPALVRTIAGSLGPFGQGHEEPLFVLPQVRIWQADIVGDAHIRTLISDWEGGPRMKAMAFRAGGTKLGDALLACRDKPLHLAGTLKIDSWSGTDKVEMHIQDGAKAL